jgi:hypothetical protein
MKSKAPETGMENRKPEWVYHCFWRLPSYSDEIQLRFPGSGVEFDDDCNKQQMAKCTVDYGLGLLQFEVDWAQGIRITSRILSPPPQNGFFFVGGIFPLFYMERMNTFVIIIIVIINIILTKLFIYLLR